MADNKDIILSVYWPSRKPEPDYYEYNYALDFCRGYLENSLKNSGINFRWNDFETGETGKSTLHPAKYILLINDPLLILSGRTLFQMMNVIDSGFDAVGPCFNISKYESQLSTPLFTVFNTTTFEELNRYSKADSMSNVKDVNVLDPACRLYSSAYISRTDTSVFFTNVSGYFPGSNICRLGVLPNSFAFTFENAEGHERSDLAALIPNEVRSLLDIGCSQGGLGRTIRNLRPEIQTEGLEVNAALADQAAQIYYKIHRTPIEDFKADKTYDCIICGDVLEHLLAPGEQLEHICGLLSKGGCLIVSVPNAGHWSLVSDLLQAKFEYLPWGITCITHLRWFTETTIRQAIEKAGFVIDIFNHEQVEPSPAGKSFISQMIGSGFGDEQSLLTHGFIIKAIKK